MLYLASKSPRRRELLTRLGVEFGLLDIDVPEQREPGEAPDDYVRRVARAKAGAGLLQVSANPSACVLGSDTEVVLDDEVFGKPADARDAAGMLGRLSGRTHRVLSAVSLVSAEREVQVLSESLVTFAPLDEAAIDAYLATSEWQGKAGAYAIQGVAEVFIQRLEGSYSGVMGLPLHETSQLLASLRTPGTRGASEPEAARARADTRLQAESLHLHAGFPPATTGPGA
ncbi:Maf family protein [Lysobacter sp. A3-1-A15]|uniref:Maf family protein n=1 Tax=Novilysobacter viscosus TaxID=3098602 RepID=UPI002ED8322C